MSQAISKKWVSLTSLPKAGPEVQSCQFSCLRQTSVVWESGASSKRDTFISLGLFSLPVRRRLDFAILFHWHMYHVKLFYGFSLRNIAVIWPLNPLFK